MILTYKYRIKDKSARKALRAHAVAANQVWNWLVAHQRDIEARYKAGAPKRKWPNHFDLTYLTTGLTEELGIPSGTITEVCRQFTESRNAARHAARFRASFGARRALGWIPFRQQDHHAAGDRLIYRKRVYRFWVGKRPLPEVIKGGAFVEDARGRWYVCFRVEVADKPRAAATGETGIDLGLLRLATCSDGIIIENRRQLAQYAERLAIAQRASNRSRVRAIHARITNARRDFLHKATTRLVQENRLIVVGNVSAARLAKTRFAKSVLDAGWTTFRSQLKYKCQQAGAVFVEADERNTSRMCSACGIIPDSSPKGMGALGIRSWTCDGCGALHDRDANAAINILRIGRSIAARADEIRRAA